MNVSKPNAFKPHSPKGTFTSTVAAVAMLFGFAAGAQTSAPTATIQGHVLNPAGQPVTAGSVQLTRDRTVPEKDEKMVYTFPIDPSGNYKGEGIAPGDYFVYILSQGKHVDRLDLVVKGGEAKTLDFDMTREEYLKNLTPEDRKSIEEFKAKNAAAASANKNIANLNNTLKSVRADLAEKAATHGDVSADVTQMKSAVDSKPDEGLLWIVYGDTLQGQGDHLAADDKTNHKPVSADPDTLKEYADAADAYKKGSDLMAAAKKPNPADQAVAFNQLGNTYAKAGKGEDATAAFENAAKLEPAKAGMYYGNEAAILFNAGQGDAAAAAADKAIAADPARADPYFIKGQALIAKSSFDSKTSKLTPPPGCVDAYQHYLSLAPDGIHAQAVKEVLASLGEKIDTRYTAGKKKG